MLKEKTRLEDFTVEELQPLAKKIIVVADAGNKTIVEEFDAKDGFVVFASQADSIIGKVLCQSNFLAEVGIEVFGKLIKEDKILAAHVLLHVAGMLNQSVSPSNGLQ